MTLHNWYMIAAIGMIITAMLTPWFMTLPLARYGRHKLATARWEMPLPTRWAWMVMEAPASLVFALIFLLGDRSTAIVPLIFFLMWQLHYFDRAFLYPLRIRARPGQTESGAIVGSAILFNSWNAFLNAGVIGYSMIGQIYAISWLSDPRFWIGAVVFFSGLYINRKADHMLKALRAPGDSVYKIPRGWLYERITSPNYLGEIIQWTGWAIATWSLGGVAFAIFTAANLVPRAIQHHRWYHEQFPDYPKDRNIILPGVY